MASSLNKVLLIGNLGKDAEMRHTAKGTAVSNFSLATSHSYKDATGELIKKTDWHNIVMWRGEKVQPYLKKGKKVFIEGRLESRSYEDQSGNKRYVTEVVVEPFGLMLLGDRTGGSSGGSDGGYAPPLPPERPAPSRQGDAEGPDTATPSGDSDPQPPPTAPAGDSEKPPGEEEVPF